MAKIRRMPVIGEMSGKVGEVVVKHYRDKIVITSIPVAPLHRSEKQKAHNERFRDAMEYARLATATDHPAQELYAQPAREQGKAANTLAVSDFFRPPGIRKVDSRGYKGQAGDRLNIVIDNVIQVREVMVTLMDGNGDLLERGPAKMLKDDIWSYTAMGNIGEKVDEASGQVGAITVVVTAIDHPGNSVEERIEMELG